MSLRGQAARLMRCAPPAVELDDLMQEGRLAQWRHAAAIAAHPSPAGAAATVSRRAMLDYLRRIRRTRRWDHWAETPPQDAQPHAVQTPADHPPEREVWARLRTVMLDREAARVLVMLMRGVPQRDIARAIHYTEGGVSRIVARAKEACNA